MILKQKSIAHGQTKFELMDDKLVVRIRKGANHSETSIIYRTLMPEYDSRASSERRYLVTGVVLVIFAVSLFFIAGTVTDQVMRFMPIMGAILLLGFAVAVVRQYLATRFDLVLFFYRNGSVAFSIDRDKPDPEAYHSLVENIVRRIKNAEEEPLSANSTSLIGELERLGKLRDKSLLTDEEFAKAKESLLAQIERGARTMGFHQD